MKWKLSAEIVGLFAAVLALGLGLKAYGPVPYATAATLPRVSEVAAALSSAPSPTITLPAVVSSVHDGDTLRVRVTFEVPVRLKDCWAPELTEKGGITSRNHLRNLCPDGTQVMVQIPFHDDISHMFTMGRVVGDILSKDGQSMAKAQVSSGNATTSKPR